MKRSTSRVAIRLCGILIVTLAARAAAAPVATGIDCGGRRIVSASYSLDGSVGGIGSVTSGGVCTVKSGYIGQLTDPASLSVKVSHDPVNEGESNQASGVAAMDDATLTVLSGGEIVWSAVVHPVASLATNGLATLAIVYANTSGSITGSYLGVLGACTFLVLDGDTDNYGIYAADGVNDGWQVRYFGTNNPLGLAAVTNVAGLRNLDSYLADLDPTNASSRLAITAITNQAPVWAVSFSPASTGRVYALQTRTSLMSGDWINVTPATNWGNGGTGWLTAPSTEAIRFYRIAVQVP